jgi:hypothetical protein
MGYGFWEAAHRVRKLTWGIQAQVHFMGEVEFLLDV